MQHCTETEVEEALDFLRKEEKKVSGEDGLNRPGNKQHDGTNLNKQLTDAGAKVQTPWGPRTSSLPQAWGA